MSALVILAEGAEEMEVVITVDVLRRGGVDVTLAGLTGDQTVNCTRNVVIKPDKSLDDAMKQSPIYDAVVLPGGGKGAQNLSDSTKVGDVLSSHYSKGKVVAAICAGPTALLSHDIGKGKSLTSHPLVKAQLEDSYKYSEDRVVVDGNLVSSRGPGTTFEFALTLVEILKGKDTRDSLIPPMLLKL